MIFESGDNSQKCDEITSNSKLYALHIFKLVRTASQIHLVNMMEWCSSNIKLQMSTLFVEFLSTVHQIHNNNETIKIIIVVAVATKLTRNSMLLIHK